MLQDLEENFGFKFLELEVMRDNFKMLLVSGRRFNFSKIFKLLKGILARQMFLLHPELKKKFWGGNF